MSRCLSFLPHLGATGKEKWTRIAIACFNATVCPLTAAKPKLMLRVVLRLRLCKTPGSTRGDLLMAFSGRQMHPCIGTVSRNNAQSELNFTEALKLAFMGQTWASFEWIQEYEHCQEAPSNVQLIRSWSVPKLNVLCVFWQSLVAATHEKIPCINRN